MKKRMICGLAAAVLVFGGVLAPAASADGYELPEDTIMLGDADGDGDVDQSDLSLMQKYSAAWDLNYFNFNNADLNCDGNVDGRDIALMQKRFAGWTVEFGRP